MNDSYPIARGQSPVMECPIVFDSSSQFKTIDPKYLYPQPTKSPEQVYSNTSEKITTGEFGLEQLMTQQDEVLSSKIDMLKTHIDQRYKLKNENLYLIDRDQCVCRNLIYAIGEQFYHPKRIELERKIIDLEQEKRRERTVYFQDILFLKKELREAEIQRIEQEQKRRFFIDETEAHSCKV